MPITCGDIMSPVPVSHGPDAMINVVASTMAEMDIGPVPIVDENTSKLIGIVTDRDIVVKAVALDLDTTSTSVRAVMTADPVACHPDDDIDTALLLMEQCQVRRIPIVDNDSKLLGIISQADVATRLHDTKQTAEVVVQISTDILQMHQHVHSAH